MTFEELQQIAMASDAIYVEQLPIGIRTRLLWQFVFLAECNEYNPDHKQLREDLLTSKIEDTEDFFTAWEEQLQGEVFGVWFTENGISDSFTNNGIGLTFDEALDIAMDTRYIRGLNCDIYILGEDEKRV